jgi:hypothetical protein
VLRSARLTLKQHRFEVGAAALGMILVGAAALWVNARMLGVIVPGGCFEAWMNAGPFGIDPRCEEPVRRFFEINEYEAGKVFAATAVLPIAAGVLVGVALVGRELEARTAQTAWALEASRMRWFVRQLWPVLVVLLVTTTFAAYAASTLESTRRIPYTSAFMDLGLYGPIVVGRAFAALGLGLFVGAALGRTLPAFIVGAVLSVVLLTAAASAPYQWAGAQPRVVLGDPPDEAGMAFEQRWRAPDGTSISDVEAYDMAAAGGAGDELDSWLRDRGYVRFTLGITAETVRAWDPVELAAWTTLGFVLVIGTVLVVNRRRPS